MLAAVVAMWRGWKVVVVVVVVLVVLCIQRSVVGTAVVSTGWRVLRVLGVVCVVLCLLARLLALSPLHPSLLQQTPLLGHPLPLLPVLPLVLADECLGLVAEDVLELAELADPRVGGRVVEVGVLLLHAALVRGVLVELRRAALRLRRRRGCLLLRGLGSTLGRRGGSVGGWRMGAVHPGARLRALGRHHGRVGAYGRPRAGGLLRVGLGNSWRRGRGGICAGRLWVGTVFLAGPNHLVRRVGAAGEGELRLVGGVLGGLLLQQAHVLVAGGGVGVGRGGLGVGNGGRDDAALLWWWT